MCQHPQFGTAVSFPLCSHPGRRPCRLKDVAARQRGAWPALLHFVCFMTYRNHKTLQKRGGAGRFERWDRDFGGRVCPWCNSFATVIRYSHALASASAAHGCGDAEAEEILNHQLRREERSATELLWLDEECA